MMDDVPHAHERPKWQTLEQLAHAVLSGKPAPGATTAQESESLRSCLDWLLLSQTIDFKSHDCSVEETLRKLAAAAPQRVCVTTFTQGDIIWKCKTCQVGDETCVICQACFQGGDHMGHDVSFYISRQPNGGCCDCGDESAWARSGFCKRHSCFSTTADLLASVPPPLLGAAESIFTSIFALMLCEVRAAQSAGDSSDSSDVEQASPLRERLSRLAYAIEWLTATCTAFDGLCCVATGALCAPLEVLAAAAGAMGDAHANAAAGERATTSGKGQMSAVLSNSVASRVRSEFTARAMQPSPGRLAPTPAEVLEALAAGLASSQSAVETRAVVSAIADRSAASAVLSGGDDSTASGPSAVLSATMDQGDEVDTSDQEAPSGDLKRMRRPERLHASSRAPSRAPTLLDLLLQCDIVLRRFSGTRRSPGGLLHALHALYLRLLTNLEFKHAFAAAYAANYVTLAHAYVTTDFEGGLLFESQISVQVRVAPPPPSLPRACAALFLTEPSRAPVPAPRSRGR